MNDENASPAVGEDCEKRLAEIVERQAEFDQLWLQMSTGNTSGATRYRELRHILDDLRAEYRKTCGELTETSSLPPRVVADWRS
jgi:hypothetical protein